MVVGFVPHFQLGLVIALRNKQKLLDVGAAVELDARFARPSFLTALVGINADIPHQPDQWSQFLIDIDLATRDFDSFVPPTLFSAG